MKRQKGFRMSCGVDEAAKGWRMSRAQSPIFVTSPTSKLILQPFRRFTYVTAHTTTLPLLHLRHSSFSNPSFASPTSQLCSFSNLSVTSPTSQFMLQPFRRFTYVTDDSPNLLLLQLRHSSFSKLSFASPTSQLCSFSNICVT